MLKARRKAQHSLPDGKAKHGSLEETGVKQQSNAALSDADKNRNAGNNKHSAKKNKKKRHKQ